jgi:hypothetical protein
MVIQGQMQTGSIQGQRTIAYQVGNTTDQGRRNVEKSRVLREQTETVLEQSRLALLESDHLIARIKQRPARGDSDKA